MGLDSATIDEKASMLLTHREPNNNHNSKCPAKVACNELHQSFETEEEKVTQNGGTTTLVEDDAVETKKTATKEYKIQLVWRNIMLMIILHSMALYGFYLFFFKATMATVIYNIFILHLIGLGITVGAHRLWSHRSYEAGLPLRIFLMILNTASLQNDIYEWSRDHRVHHKFSETDADPHNAKRGFFFAHVGWLLCKKHPDVQTKGKTVSLDDLARDPVVTFQRQFYKPLTMFFTFYLPSYIPFFFWGENFWTAFFISALRYTFSLHATWLVNSAAHLYGDRSYDKTINPAENTFVEYLALGEGYHNYHHVFPYDYSASELSWTHDYNISTWFIDMCAKLGLAWNLKKVDKKVVESRVARTGDQSLIEAYHGVKKTHSLKATFGPIFIAFIGGPILVIAVRQIAALISLLF